MPTTIRKALSRVAERSSAFRALGALVVLSALTSCALLAPEPPPGGRYLVFFEPKKSDLDTEAVEVVDRIAAGARANASDQVVIRGYADKKGQAGYNAQLSDERARAVARALMERGIEAGRLRTEAFGETTTADDPASRSADRRVEVLFRPRPQ